MQGVHLVRLVLVGPPGAGKGTQAQYIAEHLRVPQISTGDIFRANVSQGTPLGLQAKAFMDRGDLVPDDVTIDMVRNRLREPDAVGGFLLDGFPRTVPQAEVLDDMLREQSDAKLDVVLELVVDDDEVIRRLSGRRICVKNSHLYHVEFDPPKNEGVCDQDGSRLVQRDDDKPETVRHRLEVYHEQTQPLVDYYEKDGLLRRFDGKRSPGEVHDHIRATLATLRLEDEL
jgi:adenylate kinase